MLYASKVQSSALKENRKMLFFSQTKRCAVPLLDVALEREMENMGRSQSARLKHTLIHASALPKPPNLLSAGQMAPTIYGCKEDLAV